MTQKLVAGAIAAIVGFALAGAGWTLGRNTIPRSIEATGRSVVIVGDDLPPAPGSFVTPAETPSSIGPTQIIVNEIEVDDDEIVVRYDLVDRSAPLYGRVRDLDQLPGFRLRPPQGIPIAAPETWLMVVDGQRLIGSSTNTRSRRAVFELPSGISEIGDIEVLEVVEWRMRIPMTTELEFAHTDFERKVVDVGTSIKLSTILFEGDSTLIQFDLDLPLDGFSATGADGFFDMPDMEGIGENFSAVGLTEEGMQLTYHGSDLPDPFSIRFTTYSWQAFDTAVPVNIPAIGGDDA